MQGLPNCRRERLVPREQAVTLTGAPTWPPCVTYRAGGHMPSSCRPPPVTRQPALGPTGQQRVRLALHWLSATILEPPRLTAQALLMPATWPVTLIELSMLVS